MSKNPEAKKNNLEPTIFHESWWLDLATDGAFQTAVVREGGKTIGQMPYFIRKRSGVSFGLMPDMTHFLGPALDEGQGGEGTRFLRRLEITRNLIDQLPKTAFFEVKCHRGVQDVLAFQERHFKTGVQFTLEIEPQPERVVWKAMRDKRRGAIRRGLDTLKIEPIEDAEVFLHFYENNLDERDLVNNMNRTLCGRVIQGAVARGRGRMMGAWDRNGTLVAVTFCVWDTESTYFLLASRQKKSDNGAISCLAWHEIKASMDKGLLFDFDGILNEGMTQFFAGFGGIVKPRFIARRMCFPCQVAWDVKHALTGGRWFL